MRMMTLKKRHPMTITNASRRTAVVSIGNGTLESPPNAGRGGWARARRVESVFLVISAHFNRSST